MKSNQREYVCKYWLVLFLQFYFKKNHGFIEKRSPSEIVEEELDYIDIDDLGNLEVSPILVFIDEECLIVVHNGGELTTNINQKEKSDVLQ